MGQLGVVPFHLLDHDLGVAILLAGQRLLHPEGEVLRRVRKRGRFGGGGKEVDSSIVRGLEGIALPRLDAVQVRVEAIALLHVQRSPGFERFHKGFHRIASLSMSLSWTARMTAGGAIRIRSASVKVLSPCVVAWRITRFRAVLETEATPRLA